MEEKNAVVSPTYWVIWMPTTIHTCLKDNTRQDEKRDEKISDDGTNKQIITAQLKNNDIKLSFSANKYDPSKIELIEDVYEIKLKYVNSFTDGLFIYECVCVSQDEVSRALLNKPRQATIHLIKSLYHKHVFHGSSKNKDKDFYYDVYIPSFNNNLFDINEIHKNALIHYLRRIEEKYKWTVKLFENDLFDLLPKNKESRELLYKEYDDFLGETLFTNTLCTSKYANTESKNNDEVRNLLLNIENLKAYINHIRNYHKSKLDELLANKSLFWAKVGIWISVILSIISLVYTCSADR